VCCDKKEGRRGKERKGKRKRKGDVSVDRVTPEQSEVLKKHAKAHLWDRKGSRLGPWICWGGGVGGGVSE
jgi:hypothetical protein